MHNRTTSNPGVFSPAFHLIIKIVLLPAFVLSLTIQLAQASSATWNLHPTSDIWSNTRNWTPATVPDGPQDTATFALSDITTVTFEDRVDMEVNGIVFSPGASAFTITEPFNESLTMSGTGITNNSGVTQNFLIYDNGTVTFTNNATAGSDMTYTNVTSHISHAITQFFDNASAGSATFLNNSAVGDDHGGLTEFYGNSTAASATIINNPGGGSDAGTTVFWESSTAASAVITNNASEETTTSGRTEFLDNSAAANAIITNKGSRSQPVGGYTDFSTAATAANATIVNEGGTGKGGGGGSTLVEGSAEDAMLINYGATVAGATGGSTIFGFGSIGNCTVVAYGGPGQYGGGWISFQGYSEGGTARIQLFGNGKLSLLWQNVDVTLGSIEGDGVVDMWYRNLTVGSNNLSTIFRGRIIGLGKLIKIGTGRWTLAGRSLYRSGTRIEEGELVVNNTEGSGTGTGPVDVVSGRLGGKGTISGAVTIGHGAEGYAILSPGKNAVAPSTLTIRGSLTFRYHGRYNCSFDSNTSTADQVVAEGVTIGQSIFELADNSNSSLPLGLVFTVISNTAATPISGTFSNLPDGSTVTVGSNTFQADYEGGDGNDLTLTVVP